MSPLPGPVERGLELFVSAAREVLGADLVSVVLFGSGAEGQWRPTSDVNLIVVLRRFDAAAVDRLREPFRLSHAAIALEAMFILAEEVPAAAEAFAVKFADIRRRHRVLHGSDPFADLPISRPAELARCRQVLLNLTLRLRERYVLQSLRDEQAALAVADAAGPLRSAAAALLELEGKPAPGPREALAEVARALPGGPWEPLLAQISEARQQRALAPGSGAATLLRLAELAQALHGRAQQVR